MKKGDWVNLREQKNKVYEVDSINGDKVSCFNINHNPSRVDIDKSLLEVKVKKENI